MNSEGFGLIDLIFPYGVWLVMAVAVTLFGLGLGGLLTWADRRQGAMMQDRVGPNRAVVFLPSKLVAPAIWLPAAAAAVGLLAWVAGDTVEGPERAARGFAFAHAAVAALWATGLVIAGRVRIRGALHSFDRFVASLGDPRRFVYVGLACHGVVAIMASLFADSRLGHIAQELGSRSGPALTAFAIVGGATYAAVSILQQPRFGLRLFGMLHPAADGLKTIFKEDIVPLGADRLLHGLAPFISMFPALVLLAVIPFGDSLCLAPGDGSLPAGIYQSLPAGGVCDGISLPLQVFNANVGILYFFAMAGTGVVGAALAGWSSDNKFSLLGGLRAASQMVSYEVTLGLTLIGALMIYGTLRIDEMVRWQADHTWGIFVQPFAFVLFFAAAIAETKRIPFDLPEGESEIVAGYFTEYSGMKFAMFFFAEYVAIVTASALMVAVFFGGWSLPFVNPEGIEVAIGETVLFEQTLAHPLVVGLGVLGFVSKVVVLCMLQLAVRWTLPRFRYDQLMALGWRKLLPASLANILVTGVLVLAVLGASEQFVAGLSVAAELSQLLIAVAALGTLVWLVVWLLSKPRYQRVEGTSSAKYAAAAGGTRTVRMGA